MKEMQDLLSQTQFTITTQIALLAGVLWFPCSCYSGDPVKLLESWQVGTSTVLFTRSSEEEFKEFKNNGVEYIELDPSKIIRGKSQLENEGWINEIKQRADKSGIKTWSIHLPLGGEFDISNLNDEERHHVIKKLSRTMALCQPLNARKFIIHASGIPTIPDGERGERIENSIRSLKLLSEEVKKYNARLTLECLPNKYLGNTADEILAIVRSVNNGLEVCFDSNHLSKEKPEEFVAKVGKLITTVHISDCDSRGNQHWLPGQGTIDWNRVISELLKVGFEGPFLFEPIHRRPSVTGEKDPRKITSEELMSCFLKLKTDYLKSLGVTVHGSRQSSSPVGRAVPDPIRLSPRRSGCA